MQSNRLKLNPEKTHVLLMGSQRRLSSINETLKVKMNDVVLMQSTNSENLLGCSIQSNLKWQSQVSTLSSKLHRRLNVLSLLKHSCPFHIRKMIAEGIFNGVLMNCLPLYGGLDKSNIKKIQILQNKAARIVCQVPSFAHRSPLFKKLGWLTVNQLVTYHSLVVLQKIRLSREPEYLTGLLTRESRNGRIMVTNTHLGLALNSFCYRGPNEWNNLPSFLRSETNIRTFKRELKTWILNNVDQFTE